MENAVSVMLKHSCVGVEARISKFGDFFCEKLDAVGGIAEDDGLVNLQFREERVETVDLLPLFDKSIILGNASQGEFVHQVDFVRVPHVFILYKGC